jgi:hypothetical protein
MEELLGALLAVIAECLGELIVELIMGLIADALSRLLRRLFVSTKRIGPVLSTTMFALAGVGAGLLSAWLFPHPIVPPSSFHGVSLIVAPLVTGALMGFLGRGIRRRGRRSVAIESFRYGFIFALAVALVRFVLTNGVGIFHRVL